MIIRSRSELTDSFVNGQRTLSDDCLSYLMISQPGMSTSFIDSLLYLLYLSTETEIKSQGASRRYDLYFCATHFSGDGISINKLANHFLGLLGSDNTQSQLDTILSDELYSRWGKRMYDVSASTTIVFPLFTNINR